MQELAPGLRRWTAWHDDWEEEVGSLAVETSDGLIFVDPIEPPRQLDEPDHVLVTVYWHGRTTGALGADHVWASKRSDRPTAEPLRLCPERWLGKRTHADLRDTLRPLLDLPVERVLVSHGEPILTDGMRALAAVVA